MYIYTNIFAVYQYQHLSLLSIIHQLILWRYLCVNLIIDHYRNINYLFIICLILMYQIDLYIIFSKKWNIKFLVLIYRCIHVFIYFLFMILLLSLYQPILHYVNSFIHSAICLNNLLNHLSIHLFKCLVFDDLIFLISTYSQSLFLYETCLKSIIL